MENLERKSQQNSTVTILPTALGIPTKTDLIQQELTYLSCDMVSQSLLTEKVESLSHDFQDKIQTLQDSFHQAVQEFYQGISRQKEKEVDEIKSETSKAEEEIETIKQEVDALQINAMKTKHWYKDAPTIVSLIAVAFSFSTALASYVQVENQSRTAARGELRGLLQRLTALPTEQAELRAKYGDDATTYGLLSSSSNTEYTLLAHQAVELADRIPADISAPEYYAIAQALTNQGIMDPVPGLLDAGLKVSKDINSEAALLHTKANYEFIKGNVDKGRKTYELAVDTTEKYSVHPTLVTNYTAYTKMMWANSEYASGHCSEAQKVAAAASTDISNMLPGPYQTSLKSQLASAQNYQKENTQLCQS